MQWEIKRLNRSGKNRTQRMGTCKNYSIIKVYNFQNLVKLTCYAYWYKFGFAWAVCIHFTFNYRLLFLPLHAVISQAVRIIETLNFVSLLPYNDFDANHIVAWTVGVNALYLNAYLCVCVYVFAKGVNKDGNYIICSTKVLSKVSTTLISQYTSKFRIQYKTNYNHS